ncbi:MerR family transcriptional regulator [Actinophytocola xinjiangensis]|uniref:MerR family transcriptional regulator n=1 Tax=Actinophytocola xinjiangensis TaxID=485602 RepID=A0A7Z0WM76_9PSEU|nr:MerR family transcriptional regulator [Actinophytocola xinjiangensis]OLF10165.1 MerR family transcriptional regulator [Actinophytocola xinjiangensis]
MRSGEVAAAAGVNLQTLRYYERRGLLPEPPRTPGNHRNYDTEAVTTLLVVKTAQRLGFTLDEVADLLAVRHGAPDLRDRALAKIAEVETRIADLSTIREHLIRVVDAHCESLTNCQCGNCPFADLFPRPQPR